MNKIFPLKKQILIKANAQETTTASGLIIEGSGLVDSRTATVIRVGPDVTTVKPGYLVYINWTKALPVKIEGKEFSFIEEDNLVAIMDSLE
jgi:co-chaperonin GroES (HSP10)